MCDGCATANDLLICTPSTCTNGKCRATGECIESHKPSLAELVKAAQARFDALSPEEQREHREMQRKSWVVGETMMSHPEMTREEAEALYDRMLRGVL